MSMYVYFSRSIPRSIPVHTIKCMMHDAAWRMLCNRVWFSEIKQKGTHHITRKHSRKECPAIAKRDTSITVRLSQLVSFKGHVGLIIICREECSNTVTVWNEYLWYHRLFVAVVSVCCWVLSTNLPLRKFQIPTSTSQHSLSIITTPNLSRRSKRMVRYDLMKFVVIIVISPKFIFIPIPNVDSFQWPWIFTKPNFCLYLVVNLSNYCLCNCSGVRINWRFHAIAANNAPTRPKYPPVTATLCPGVIR